jgi:hypothetical protein
VRRRRLALDGTLPTLSARPGAERRADDGLRRLALAAVARSLGVEVSRAEAHEAGAAWLDALGVPRANRERFLRASGLDAAEAERVFEVLALEERLLRDAARLLPDGPSREEGLALAARLDGSWAEAGGQLRLEGRKRRGQAPR